MVRRRSQRDGKPAACLGRVLLLAAVSLGPVPPAAHADRSIRLRADFEGRRATVRFRIPDDWKGQTRGPTVKLVAPSRRDGCTHVLRLDLNLLYVAMSVSSGDWVHSRLSGAGPLVTGAGGEYSWGVAARRGARASAGSGAQTAGTGRYGQIMSEVRASSDVSARCPGTQGAKAAKRLGRVLQGLNLSSVKRRR